MDLSPISNPISQLIKSMVAENVSRAFKGSKRWTILDALPGVNVHGVAIGRRLVKPVGITLVLALQEDGSFKPCIVPVDECVQPKAENRVRADFVRERRPQYAPRGHAFRASPVFTALCADCGRQEYVHTQEKIRIGIETIFDTYEVTVSFDNDSTVITDLRLRPRTSPPLPDFTCDARKIAWAQLTGVEQAQIVSSSARVAKNLPILIPCAFHDRHPWMPCPIPPSPPPAQRLLTEAEWSVLIEELGVERDPGARSSEVVS